MYDELKNGRLKNLKPIIILFMVSSAKLEALQYTDNLWVGFNTQAPLNVNEKWLGSLTSQARFIKQRHSFELAFIEPCLGYQFVDNSLWAGYRYTKHVNNPPSFSENRLIQQWISNHKNSFMQYVFRSRLEERYRSNQKQVALLLRERVSLEFPWQISCRINPFLFNEVFFVLNKTIYNSRKLIGENRLFIGFNYYIHKKAWWEIGYIMRYRTNTPLNRHYQLNHILSINYTYR